jgi:hypothetical protein
MCGLPLASSFVTASGSFQDTEVAAVMTHRFCAESNDEGNES